MGFTLMFIYKRTNGSPFAGWNPLDGNPFKILKIQSDSKLNQMNNVDTFAGLRMKTYPDLRHRLFKLICLVGAGLGLLISGCDHRNADPLQHYDTTENNKMESALATTDNHRQIPPIDISQPREIKTATFALG